MDVAIDPQRVAIYIRWSTEEQSHGTTLAVQQEACEHFLRSQGWAVNPDLLFVDDGYTGANLERPGMTRLRAAVQAGQVDCVVVYKLDRLSRSVVDTVNLALQEWEGKCHLKSAREPIDTLSPAGKMFFYMLVSYAEFERSTIRERTLSGKRKRAEAGRNAGHRYAYGYRKGSGGGWEIDGQQGEGGGLVGPAAIVRRIYTEYLSGAGIPEIAAGLAASGVPGPRGGTWHPSTVHAILRNPAYAGTYVYGRRSVTAGESRGGVACAVEGALPPLVSAADWARVQELRRRRGGVAARARHGQYLLTGIAHCGLCGAGLCGSGRSFHGCSKRYYVCTAGRAANCQAGDVAADGLEQAVLHEVRVALAALVPPSLSPWLADELRRRQGEGARVVRSHTTALSSAQRRATRLQADHHGDGRNEDAWLAQCAQATRDEERARTALEYARTTLGRLTDALEHLAELSAQLAPVDPLAHLTPVEAKQLLPDLIGGLQVWQERKPRGPGTPRANTAPLVVRLTLRTDGASDAAVAGQARLPVPG